MNCCIDMKGTQTDMIKDFMYEEHESYPLKRLDRHWQSPARNQLFTFSRAPWEMKSTAHFIHFGEVRFLLSDKNRVIGYMMPLLSLHRLSLLKIHFILINTPTFLNHDKYKQTCQHETRFGNKHFNFESKVCCRRLFISSVNESMCSVPTGKWIVANC